MVMYYTSAKGKVVIEILNVERENPGLYTPAFSHLITLQTHLPPAISK